MNTFDCVDWLCDVWQHVGQKQAELGSREAVSDWERLIDILGWTEYCVSNAGDFENMIDVYPEFQRDAVGIARSYGLVKTTAMFELSREQLGEKFSDHFISVCAEIRDFITTLPDSGSVGKASLEWKPI